MFGVMFVGVSEKEFHMTAEEVRDILRKAIDGNASAWARPLGISQAYVSDVLAGRREPGDKILQALKLEKVVTYRRARPSA